jgi:hypothetical protein
MVGRILVGFAAAVLAVLLVHQPIIAALAAAKVIPSVAYNLAPLKNAPVMVASVFGSLGMGGWPTLFNLLFWGGLWGALYGVAFAPLPMAGWLKGLLLGIAVVVAGNWLLVPWIKGQPLFGNFEPTRMVITAVLNVPFGIATALFYGWMRGAQD